MRPEDVPDAVVDQVMGYLVDISHEEVGRTDREEVARALLADVLNLEEVWVGGPDAAPLPPQIITHEGVFLADGVTPFEVTDEVMRAAGWKRQRRLSTGWVDA